MTNNIKISFAVPSNLQKDLKERIVLDGYSLKGKSLWVSEAIERLLKMETYTDLVKLNYEMQSGFEKLESILVDRQLKSQIDASVITVKRKYPEIDGVQSRIMRTAILQRLVQF